MCMSVKARMNRMFTNGASIAAGLTGSYEESVEKLIQSKVRYVPNPELEAHYSTRYKTSRDLVDLMRNYWRKASGS